MSDKPSSDPEAEYFARLDREKKAAIAEEIAAEKAKAEREERKKIHHLRCGKCGGQLEEKAFRGVTIDICASCGAVLLDPGELEALAGKDESGALTSLARFFKRG